VQSVHQRLDSDRIRNINFRDDSLELLHEVAEALAAGMSEVPQVGHGRFLVGEHDIILQEGRREVVETIDGVFSEACEPSKGRSF